MRNTILTVAFVGLGTVGAIAQFPEKGPIPEVTAFDKEGKEFPLATKLKDHYSVVVFGCLT